MTRQVSRQINVYSHIQKSGNLPTIPEVLLRLLEACEYGDAASDELTAIIETDPALSFSVMQLANSAYFQRRAKFTGVRYAVDHVGFDSIKNIALTTSIHQVFERKKLKRVPQFNICSFWFHSLLCANISRRLARKTGYRNADEAYLAGLIHDIGRLILVSAFPKEHEAILLETEDKKNVLWAEEQLLGITHNQAGAWLVKKWNQDSLMADAIRYHHESLAQIEEAFPLVKIVYLANALSESMQNNEDTTDAGKKLFRLSSIDMDNLMDDALAEVCQLAENLDTEVDRSAVGQEKTSNGVQEDDDGASTSSSASSLTLCPVSSQIKNQVALISLVKSNSLVSGFTEKFVQAGDFDDIIASYEKSVNILFHLDKVMLFLPDTNELFLHGKCSSANNLQGFSQGLSLPIGRSTSKIVRSYTTAQTLHMHVNEIEESLADNQIMEMINSESILLLPMIVSKKTVGVALLAMPRSTVELPASEKKILNVLTQQLALNMHLEETQTKQAEKSESESMAAVSMTARKVAHEINNPLGIINNYLKAMSLKFSDNSELTKELGIIGEEIDRISMMVKQMGVLSPSENLEVALLDVNDSIADIVGLVRSSLFNGDASKLRFSPAPDLPQIKTSQNGLKQILVNLLKNAAEAMGDADDVVVSTKAVASRHGSVKGHKGGIEIRVHDSGPGLPAMVSENLFTPFVTTKKNGHSGLGLSIVNKIVGELKGTISCTSSAEGGTCFTMYFPVA